MDWMFFGYYVGHYSSCGFRDSCGLMISVKQLIAALGKLSDAEFQRRAWLATNGPEISSFTEDVCQVFDDTGLSDALNRNVRPPELDERAFTALKELDSAVSRVDQNADPLKLLDDPKVEDVRRAAARALALIGK